MFIQDYPQCTEDVVRPKQEERDFRNQLTIAGLVGETVM
jgi:hypothetical protein